MAASQIGVPPIPREGNDLLNVETSEPLQLFEPLLAGLNKDLV
jgi:hypothetical protein